MNQLTNALDALRGVTIPVLALKRHQWVRVYGSGPMQVRRWDENYVWVTDCTEDGQIEKIHRSEILEVMKP